VYNVHGEAIVLLSMGSPISSTLAEIYLQFPEEIYIKQWVESKEIYYRR